MDYVIRKGQTATILLAYTVNGESLVDIAPDELEFTFGGVKYYLSDGDISLDEDGYSVYLSQEATMALPAVASYQLRVLKDGNVGVSDIEYERIGKALSEAILPILAEVELA